MNSLTSIGIESNQKLQEWNEKKSLQLRENALRIASIAVFAILGAAATLAAIYLIPIVPVASSLIFTLGAAGAGGYIAIVLSTLVHLYSFDTTNYRNPFEVTRLLKELKGGEEPLPLSRFKRMHRFGIISAKELDKRSELEPDCKRYGQLLGELKSMRRELSTKERRLESLQVLTSMADQKSTLKKEIEELNEVIEKLETEKNQLIEKFAKFNQSIVDFNPHKK